MSPVDFLVTALAVLAAAALAAWVTRPLRLAAPRPPMDCGEGLDLLLRREAAALELSELDADLAAGRIDRSDFVQRRADIAAEGKAVLAALEGLTAREAADAAARIARVERDVASARTVRQAQRCFRCGRPGMSASDRFCATCGAPLVGEVGAGPHSGADEPGRD